MGSFLDKVGLQHFVEKIKSLLSGYLPLSGGTMTGAIKFGNTLLGTLGTLSLSREGIQTSQTINKKTWTAAFNTKECNTRRFVLSGDSSAGLIANDSYTVVKKLEYDLIKDMILENISSSEASACYVSGDNLNDVISLLELKNIKIIVQTSKDTKAFSFLGGSSTILKANINYCLTNDIWGFEDTSLITSIIYKGKYYLEDNSFTNLKTFDATESYEITLQSLKDLFAGCQKLTYVSINNWDVSEVNTLDEMFLSCTALKTLQLDKWDTQNVCSTNSMFSACTNLLLLNLKGWNMENVLEMTDMFKGCSSITTLTLSEGFGRMKDSVGTVDFSAMTKWTNNSVQTLLDLYDRKANGMGVITIKLSAATKNALGTSGIQTLTAKGYTIA